jgi:hypothetical protein
MVILPKLMVLGVLMAKNIWRASVSFVDRHPKLFTATTVLLLVFAVFVTGVNRGYVEIITSGHTPNIHYQKIADVTIQPAIFMLWSGNFRIGAGVEIGYIRPVSVSVMASLPMFEEIDKDDIALGIGLDTQVLDNFFVGASYNWQFSGSEFWAVYGKLLFGR